MKRIGKDAFERNNINESTIVLPSTLENVGFRDERGLKIDKNKMEESMPYRRKVAHEIGIGGVAIMRGTEAYRRYMEKLEESKEKKKDVGRED